MAISLSEVEQFLYREARLLDDREFDEWLEFYAPDAEFWMPAWDDDDTLVTDPQREISLIWYGNRGGLEDRVFRIKTDRSSATSLPEPRTCHNITNVEILEPGRRPGRGALQLVHAVLPLQDDRHLLRHVVLHARHLGPGAAHQEQEGRPEERLHPPRRRHLPRLIVGASSGDGDGHELPDRAELRGRRHPLHRVQAERDSSPTPPTASASTSRWTAATAPAAPARASASRGLRRSATTSRTR